ncbi:MAG: hypothetical protein KGV56_00255 [Gammaproteobacteria bacterium]|nr:hypothetical protein [Gammaproteobacteria bacterium]
MIRQHLYAVINENNLLLGLFPERQKAKEYANNKDGKVIFTSTGLLDFLPKKIRKATWPKTQGEKSDE